MNRNKIRLLLVLGTLSIVGIILSQTYWLKQAYNIRESQFNVNVNLGLRNVTDSILLRAGKPFSSDNPVSQISSAYFVVNPGISLDPILLETLLRKEFIKRNLQQNFGLVICDKERLVFGKCVSFNNTTGDTAMLTRLPRLNMSNSSFGIYFPSKGSSVVGQMKLWLISTAVLFAVIVLFVYSMVVILKQKRLSEIQKDFVNNMTHEFQTPLSSISISSKILMDPAVAANPERMKNYAGVIHTESVKLQNQVERLLEMSKLEEGAIRLNTEQCDLHDLILKSREKLILAHKLNENQVKLELDAADHELVVDPLHFSNIIYNLLDNAVKYSPKPEIRISTRNSVQGIWIRVEDKGIGIAKEHLNKIFDRFYRVPTGKRHDVKGFGLGLSYVQKLTLAHQGLVDVKSVPGQGTEFSLFFPFQRT